MGGKQRYEVFISYSTDPDQEIAEALEHELQRFLRPWYRPGPRYRVFRDASDLSPGAGLSEKISAGLAGSKHLVTLLSPRAARPDGWVEVEAAQWCELHDHVRVDDGSDERPVSRTITPVVTEWPAGTRGAALDELPNLAGFDWAGDDVPPALRQVFDEAPLAVDLRWAHSAEAVGALTLAHPGFKDAVTSIAAGVLGVPRSEFDAVVRSMKRRAMLLVGTIIAAIVILSLTIFANIRLRQDAERERNAAVQEQLAAEDATRSAQFELDRVGGELEARQGDLALAEQQLTAAEDDLGAARDELADAGRRLEDADAALIDANDRLAQTADDLNAARGDLAAAEADVAAAIQERTDAIAAQQAAQREVDRLGDLLSGLESAVTEAEAALDAANQNLTAAEAEAEQQLAIADARRLSSLAQASLSSDLSRATLLAVEATLRTASPRAPPDEQPGALLAAPRIMSEQVTYEARDALMTSLFTAPNLVVQFDAGGNEIRAVAASGDGSVIVGLSGGSVIIWDSNTLQPTGRIDVDIDGGFGVDIAIDPLGQTVAVGTGTNEPTIRFYDLASGEQIAERRLNTGFGEPQGLAYSPSGRFFAAGSSDQSVAGLTGPVRVWDLESGQAFDLPGTIDGRSVAFAPDDRLVAVVDRNGLSLWGRDTVGWTPIELPSSLDAGSVSTIVIDDAGRLVVAAADDTGVVRLDLETDETETVRPGEDTSITDLAVIGEVIYVEASPTDRSGSVVERWSRTESDEPSPTWVRSDTTVEYEGSEAIAAAASRLVTGGDVARLWDFDIDVPIVLSDDRPVLDVQPGGRLLALSAPDGSAAIVDIATFDTLMTLRPPIPQQTILDLRLSVRGDVAIGRYGPQEELARWNMTTGAVASIGNAPDGPVDAISADGRLAVSITDTRAHVWQTMSGEVINTIEVDRTVQHARFAGDDVLIVATNDELTTWAIDPPQRLAAAPLDPIRDLAVNSDAGMVFVVAGDEIRELSVPELRPVGRFRAPPEAKLIVATTVSLDDSLVAGSIDRSIDGRGAVVVWDRSSRQPYASLLVGHVGIIIGFGPTRIWFGANETLITSGMNPETRRWQLDPNVWIDIACRRAGRNLTADEWAEVLPTQPYRATCPQFSID